MRKAANTEAQLILPTETSRLFSLRHEFSTEWYQFLNPENGNDQELIFKLKEELYPFFIRGKLSGLKIKSMEVFVESSFPDGFISDFKVTDSSALSGLLIDKDENGEFKNVYHLQESLTASSIGEIRVKIKKGKIATVGDFKSLTSDDLDNIFILFQLGV